MKIESNWERFRNDSSETIPPHGIMVVIATDLVDDDFVLAVDKPATASLSLAHIVNGPSSVPVDGFGDYWNGGGMFPIASAGPHAPNAEIGPVNNSWEAGAGGSGYQVVGQVGSQDLWLVRLVVGGAVTVFPVTLTQVGGVDGTRTTIATWTYNVRKIGEVVDLFSAINPVTAPHQYEREALGMRTKATYGLCALDAAGDPFVIWINETIGVSACEVTAPSSPPEDGLEEEFL